MKKLVLVLGLGLALLSMNITFGQLNKNAEILKATGLDRYTTIKFYSMNKWGEKHDMVLYEINKQCNALAEILFVIIDEPNYDKDILIKATGKWGLYEPQWDMVVYEYKKQLKAKNQY